MKKGYPELRRRFRKWGAIRVSSGTPRKRLIKKMDDMLVALGQAGRFDYLTLLKDGVLTPLQLLDHLRGRDITGLPPAHGFARLADAWDAWADTARCTDSHRHQLKYHGRRLRALKEEARGNDLPELLGKLRVADEERGTFRAFNYTRACALAYLRDHGGQRTDLYAAALAVKVLPTARRRQGHPCTPDEAWTLACDLGALWGRVWIATCYTGMGSTELWGAWEAANDGLHVAGTKREGRDRLVPLVYLPERPPFALGYGTMLYRKAIAAASKGTVQPYDGRRTFAKWIGLTGVDPIHQDAYLGHGPKSMTALYQQGNVAPYLEADAARVRTFGSEVDGKVAKRVREIFGANSPEALLVKTDAPRRARTPNLLIRSQVQRTDTEGNRGKGRGKPATPRPERTTKRGPQ